MNKEEHKIITLDKDNQVTGWKYRKDINRRKDILFSVHILVQSGEALLLERIPADESLPKLYNGRLGSPMATFVREGESELQAAQRAMIEEGGLDNTPIHLGTEFDCFDQGIYRRHGTFLIPADKLNTQQGHGEIVTMTISEIAKKLAEDPEQFATTFKIIFNRYKKDLG